MDKKALTVTVHAECGNCGATLMGPYCFRCGQHAHDSARSISALFHDAWHIATHVDSRFWQTLYILLLKLGKLTKEYFAEKRTRYLPPVRVYLPNSAAQADSGDEGDRGASGKRRYSSCYSLQAALGWIAVWLGWSAFNGWVIALVSIYTVSYVYRAMRVYYGQGRLLTLSKLCAVGFTYMIGFSVTLLVTFIFSAIIA